VFSCIHAETTTGNIALSALMPGACSCDICTGEWPQEWNSEMLIYIHNFINPTDCYCRYVSMAFLTHACGPMWGHRHYHCFY
jgi:hypothetical protein